MLACEELSALPEFGDELPSAGANVSEHSAVRVLKVARCQHEIHQLRNVQRLLAFVQLPEVATQSR